MKNMIFFDFRSHNGSPITLEITGAFFSKLQFDFGIEIFGTGFAYCHEINVPASAYMIDDELYVKNPEIIRYILSEYSKKKIVELNNSSLEELHIEIIFYKHILNAELDKMFHQLSWKSQLLCEETLWVNMTNEEKIIMMEKYFTKIETMKNELKIIDAYLAPKTETNDYFAFITQILNATKAKTITVYTKKSQNDFERIKENLDMPLKIIDTSHFHDRFWLTQKKGFLTGTSFNGIGKRFSVIYELTSEDVNNILSEIRTLSL